MAMQAVLAAAGVTATAPSNDTFVRIAHVLANCTADRSRHEAGHSRHPICIGYVFRCRYGPTSRMQTETGRFRMSLNASEMTGADSVHVSGADYGAATGTVGREPI